MIDFSKTQQGGQQKQLKCPNNCLNAQIKDELDTGIHICSNCGLEVKFDQIESEKMYIKNTQNYQEITEVEKRAKKVQQYVKNFGALYESLSKNDTMEIERDIQIYIQRYTCKNIKSLTAAAYYRFCELYKNDNQNLPQYQYSESNNRNADLLLSLVEEDQSNYMQQYSQKQSRKNSCVSNTSIYNNNNINNNNSNFGFESNYLLQQSQQQQQNKQQLQSQMRFSNHHHISTNSHKNKSVLTSKKEFLNQFSIKVTNFRKYMGRLEAIHSGKYLEELQQKHNIFNNNGNNNMNEEELQRLIREKHFQHIQSNKERVEKNFNSTAQQLYDYMQGYLNEKYFTFFGNVNNPFESIKNNNKNNDLGLIQQENDSLKTVNKKIVKKENDKKNVFLGMLNTSSFSKNTSKITKNIRKNQSNNNNSSISIMSLPKFAVKNQKKSIFLPHQQKQEQKPSMDAQKQQNPEIEFKEKFMETLKELFFHESMEILRQGKFTQNFLFSVGFVVFNALNIEIPKKTYSQIVQISYSTLVRETKEIYDELVSLIQQEEQILAQLKQLLKQRQARQLLQQKKGGIKYLNTDNYLDSEKECSDVCQSNTNNSQNEQKIKLEQTQLSIITEENQDLSSPISINEQQQQQSISIQEEQIQKLKQQILEQKNCLTNLKGLQNQNQNNSHNNNVLKKENSQQIMQQHKIYIPNCIKTYIKGQLDKQKLQLEIKSTASNLSYLYNSDIIQLKNKQQKMLFQNSQKIQQKPNIISSQFSDISSIDNNHNSKSEIFSSSSSSSSILISNQSSSQSSSLAKQLADQQKESQKRIMILGQNNNMKQEENLENIIIL